MISGHLAPCRVAGPRLLQTPFCKRFANFSRSRPIVAWTRGGRPGARGQPLGRASFVARLHRFRGVIPDHHPIYLKVQETLLDALAADRPFQFNPDCSRGLVRAVSRAPKSVACREQLAPTSRSEQRPEQLSSSQLLIAEHFILHVFRDCLGERLPVLLSTPLVDGVRPDDRIAFGPRFA